MREVYNICYFDNKGVLQQFDFFGYPTKREALWEVQELIKDPFTELDKFVVIKCYRKEKEIEEQPSKKAEGK